MSSPGPGFVRDRFDVILLFPLLLAVLPSGHLPSLGLIVLDELPVLLLPFRESVFSLFLFALQLISPLEDLVASAASSRVESSVIPQELLRPLHNLEDVLEGVSYTLGNHEVILFGILLE